MCKPIGTKRSIEDGLNPAYKQSVLAHGTCNGIDTDRFCKDAVNAEVVRLAKKRVWILMMVTL